MLESGLMKIFIDNVNLNSSSGPNGFAKKISNELIKDNEIYVSIDNLIKSQTKPDVQLSFIATQYKIAPIVQRLDGIYFNSDQDFNLLNSPIETTYEVSDAVIFQSDFNKQLTEKYFGIHKNSHVIRNGTCIEEISEISPMENSTLDNFENVWSCASSWRPHKRLQENIDYFLKFSSENDCLVISGENPDVKIENDRIFYSGHLSWSNMISLMKRSKYFLHLAWLDHCPNVVIDARATGCHIICSSAGGTKEVAGKNSTVIIEDEWDFSPIKLYNPPKMDFSKTTSTKVESNIDIKSVSKKYLDIFSGVI
jgi:glycosyltransferase involved in cell wall biosynthesis|tara:strand:+ start:4699 stop:5628 length:930 start_codon:yes stop_codon:yes gene_type:complete